MSLPTSTRPASRRVPHWPASSWVLHASLLVLPLAAVAAALPEWPHWALVGLVVVSATRWSFAPEDVAGPVTLALVAGWWGVHDDTGWRLLLVGALLVTAHVCAVLASYGPGLLAVGRPLVLLWARRWVLLVATLLLAWLAVRWLPQATAPGWVWPLAVATTLAGVLAATLARPEEQGP